MDKFAGNFKGLAQKLDYLKDLGVNTVHILPHYPSPMVDDGYDVSDYKSVRSELGTFEDFEIFAKKAGAMDIKVIVDLVLNHASTKHPWFLEASQNKSGAIRELFLWSGTGKEYQSAINAFPTIKPKNWIYNPPTGDYYFSTFYPDQADFDWRNPEVFDIFTDIMDFWVKKGVSGFRLDAASHLIKKEGTNCKGVPETHQVLMKIRKYIDENFPDVILFAEVHDTLPKMKEYFDNGHECHLTYNFYANAGMMLAFAREDKFIFSSVCVDCALIPESTAWANYLRNHDEISLAGLTDSERLEVVNGFDPDGKYRFEAFVAMRLASIFKGDKEKIKRAFEWLFEVPGAHIIYYGDEIGMENEEISAGEDMRRVMRGKFDWKAVEAQKNDPASLYSAVKAVIAEHSKIPVAPFESPNLEEPVAG